ncbi:MAG TPA: hypothetical protein VFC17_09220 [Candidatus Limnocylindrales bacterium]|nr:hypothetical protein [Candidatus Limnocylindrales bacterium]
MKKIFIPVLAGFLAVTGLTIRAAEAGVNPTGTWRVAQVPKSTYEPILKLKLDGDKLTGTITRNTGTKIEVLPIEEGKLKGSEISFTTHFFSQVIKNGVIQPADTNHMSHWKFQGTISGDDIKGNVEKESPVGSRIQDWEAKRAKA